MRPQLGSCQPLRHNRGASDRGHQAIATRHEQRQGVPDCRADSTRKHVGYHHIPAQCCSAVGQCQHPGSEDAAELLSSGPERSLGTAPTKRQRDPHRRQQGRSASSHSWRAEVRSLVRKRRTIRDRALITRLLYRGSFARLVSLYRFAYVADAVVHVCFSSEMVSCRSIPGAVALRSHREQERRAETVTPGSDRGRRHS